LKELTQAYQKRKKEARQKTEQDLLTQMEGLGIRGSAVQPKVEGSLEWGKSVSKLRPAFEEELRSAKKEIKI
jgi:hypothetical protein